MPDLSDEEWYDDVGDTGSICSSNASDEEWLPDSEDEDSDDENKEYSEDPSSNWLEDNEQSSNERRSIVFDTCLKQLFQICRNCGDVLKKAYLKQRGSLICVTTVCIAGHTELWFSQPFTKGTATRNLICTGGILFTGNHFSRASALMSACNIRFFKKGRSIFGQWSTMVTLPSRTKFCRHLGDTLLRLPGTDYVRVQSTTQSIELTA